MHRITAIVLLAAWLVVVILTTMNHEYWRDEVRPWLLAGAAHSPVDLFERTRYDGHPLLWFLILYFARSTFDTPLVLPVVSIAIAAAAMAILLFRSPFPLWMKGLFLFSALPLYEYSVMARNYGISMLLMFLAALLYRERRRQWLSLSIVLALLANTNVHTLVLTALWLLIWAADEIRAREGAADQPSGKRFFPAMAIVLAGVALSLLAAHPPRDTVLTQFYAQTPHDFAVALRGAVVAPAAAFATLFPPFVPWALGHVILYVTVLGLLRRPILSLAAFGGLVALGVLFRVAYAGSYRHSGLLLCFLLSLYWLALDQPDRTPRGPRMWLFNAGRYGALLVLILASVYKDHIVWVDLRSEMSSSKAVGAFLTASPEFHDAILVPEPDYYIESVPYYAPNTIYFPREHRFGTTVTWSTAADADLSLGQIVSVAEKLKARYARPVLVVLGHPSFATDSAGDIRYLYRKRFTWSAAERAEALRHLTPVAQFVSAVGNENYWLYAVR